MQEVEAIRLTANIKNNKKGKTNLAFKSICPRITVFWF